MINCKTIAEDEATNLTDEVTPQDKTLVVDVATVISSVYVMSN